MSGITDILNGLPSALLAASWQATLLFCIIAAVSLVFRKSSPNFHYWLWCIVLLRFAFPFELTIPVGFGENVRNSATLLPGRMVSEKELAALLEQLQFKRFASAPGESIAIGGDGQQPGGETGTGKHGILENASSNIPLSASNILLLLWLFPVCSFGLLILFRIFAIRRILSRSREIDDGRIVALLEALKNRMGITRSVLLRQFESGSHCGPAVIGVLKPVIILEAAMTVNWSVEELEPVLMHELAHVKRHDLLINLVQIAVQTLYFFHPLSWYVNWKIRALREDASDDTALSYFPGEREQYSERLLRVIKETSTSRLPAVFTIGFTETRSSLSRRIIRILDEGYRNYPKMKRASFVFILAVASAGIFLSSGAGEKKEDRSRQIHRHMDELKIAFQPVNLVFDEILSGIRRNGKPGMLYVAADSGWCSWPGVEQFIKNDTIGTYIEKNFTSFYIPAYTEEGSSISGKYVDIGLPYLVFIDSGGKLIEKISGKYFPSNLLKRLKDVHENSGTFSSLADAQNRNPENAAMTAQLALKTLLAFDYEEAVTLYEHALNGARDDSLRDHIYLHLGDAAWRAGQIEKAITIWIEGLESGELQTRKEEATARLGRLLFQEKRYREAIRYLERIPDDYSKLYSPVNWEALQDFEMSRGYLGAAYWLAGDEEKGKEILDNRYASFYTSQRKYFDNNRREFITSPDNNYFGILQLISLTAGYGVYFEGALHWAETLLADKRAESLDKIVKHMYAYVLDKVGRFEEAIRVAAELIASDNNPDLAFGLRISLAFSYHKSGQNARHSVLLDSLAAESLNNPVKLHNLAGACDANDMYLEPALLWAEEALKSCTENKWQYLWTYARLLSRNNRKSEAYAIAREAYEETPRRLQAYREQEWKDFLAN